ncbi:protein ALTERED PHOSPHATE STARVATION RESPONSE 1-like [Zingiber officinale]|uniref:protein ALTERED PHOSPHATE STARVATION RESPONSE 1-like n=1 Tax=Zingiber officinale TaxID=94328 RepID=UPI001C4B5FB3|nr:protein ALTERED PHOSPHATE STARVATION RESPONSE 1-like [Zingiber officinale]
MGCAHSRVDNEEAVTRCKERRQWIKSAVAARNAFAAAHSAYAVALKNTGAALSEFGQGETHDLGASCSAAAGVVAGSLVSGSEVVAQAIQPPIDTLPPPPPPLPEFSPSPLQRSISMPDLPKKFASKAQRDASIREDDDEGEDDAEEEEEEEDEEDDVDNGLEHRRRPAGIAASSPSPSPSPVPPPPPPQHSPPPPPPPMPQSKHSWDYFFFADENMQGSSVTQAEEVRPERNDASVPANHHTVGGNDDQVTPKKLVLEMPLPSKVPRKLKQGNNVHHQHAVSAPPLDAKKGKIVPATRPSVSLLKVLTDLDDLFLKASENTYEVSKMLEATRMHYHSNFADARGHIDHSARVMRVITWNRSFKGIPDPDGGNDDFDNDEWETHATVLDKILAWERKLYDEVKAGELMKIEYQRKVGLLNRQKKRGASIEALERTKAAVSHLHTRYIVDMQSMDSTVSEIQRLRDKQLYPKLVELVEGMAQMWQAMHAHHIAQLKIVEDLKIVDLPCVMKETTEHHFKHTLQLHDIAEEWHLQFGKLVSHQKEYIDALNSWLKLNLIPIESSLKEKVSSPQRPTHAPIQALLHTWHEHLEKLPDELAKNAIHSFSVVIKTILTLQQEELKQKDKCNEIHKEYVRKSRAFEDWAQRYSQKRMASTVGETESGEVANPKDLVEEKKLVVESAKSRFDDEMESHKRLCKQVREKSVTSLKTHLPELFRAMSDFADACSRMYASLKMITEHQEQQIRS